MGRNTHTMPFVHLRVQSAYSIGVGVSTPGEICRYAKRCGFGAVALTDVGGTWGFVEFHRAATEYGIKPIYGITVGLGREGAAPEADLVVLALDRTGLQKICALTSRVDADAPRGGAVAPDDLKNSDGMVCIVAPRVDGSGAGTSLIGRDPERRRKELEALHHDFGDRLFVGFTPGDEEPIRPWLAAAGELKIHTVLVQDVRYVGFKQYSFVSEDKRPGSDEGDSEGLNSGEPLDRYRFLSLQEMSGWYADHPDAYANVSMIASLVHPDLLDRLDVAAVAPESQTLFDGGTNFQVQLETLASQRFDAAMADADPEKRERYRTVLADELAAIGRAKIAEPFLKFHAVLSRLDELEVTVGPATGMRLQSLCAWLLGITRFDPYETDDRFVADLESAPLSRKILDLQIAGRDRSVATGVIRQLFGADSVGYIPTVEHVTPVRALKVAGGEMDIDSDELDRILGIAGDHPGVSLQKLFEENREIGRLYRRSGPVRELFQTAAAIEGLPLGFIRSKRTLIASSAPIKRILGHTVQADGAAVFFQSTRDSFPTASVFRIDIGTLGALGVCAGVESFLEPEQRAGRWWRRSYEETEVPGVFSLIGDGDTFGVYLLESPLAQRLAEEFSIRSFDDLVNFLALMRLRRGDMSFARRVEAFARETPVDAQADPEISFLLNDTRGWILFTDQLRDILSVVTARSGGEALALFRRFGARGAGELAGLRREYMKGAAEADVPMETASAWFKRLLYYRPRVLDRQQVIADSLLVTRMLRFKHLHRAAFFAALLNEHRDNRSRLDKYMRMADAEGLLLSPHVNRSDRRFRPENGLVRLPLTRIVGLDEAAADAVLQTREQKPFADLKDLVSRVPSEVVGSKQIEAIVAAGAIDTASQLGKAREPGDVGQRRDSSAEPRAKSAQPDLFRDSVKNPTVPGEGESFPELPHTKKDGNMRSGFHVLRNIAEFYPHPTAARVELVGRVRDLRSFETSSGDETSFFVLFDTSASIPVFAPREQIGQAGEPLADGDRVLVRGIVRIRDRRKVCHAVEVQAEGGAISDGETSSDEPPEGDP